jgi:hypothetical protein
MKKQTWFETDLGYAATKDMLLKSKDFIGDPEGDYQGRFTFHLRRHKDFTVQITTQGKLGITYPEKSSYDIILEQLKPCLVKADNTPAKIIKQSYTSEDPNYHKADSRELLSPCEFLQKNERIMLGFVKECPRSETEMNEYLESRRITGSAKDDLLNKELQTRKIFRVEKDGTIFYRFNDFPDEINAILILLENATDTEPWTRLLIDKLRYNIITSFPKYDLKRIVQATAIEVRLSYQQFLNQVSKAAQEVVEALGKVSKLSFEDLKSASQE